jgi:hypothetical protein
MMTCYRLHTVNRRMVPKLDGRRLAAMVNSSLMGETPPEIWFRDLNQISCAFTWHACLCGGQFAATVIL